MNINEEYIYNLFETQNKKEIIINGIKRKSERLKIQLTEQNETSLSPNAKNILEYLTPYSKERMINDMISDDKDLKIEEILEENNDIEYTYFENKEVGTFMELYICSNFICPGCKKGKLLKYINPNMPIIDAICSSDEHKYEHGPKYYQIKTTEKDTSYNGMKYFDKKLKYIHTGSKKYGKLCHEVKLGDDFNKKKILISYICIQYTKNERIISIDLNESFIIIPNLYMEAITLEENELKYYSYLDTKIPYITFNLSLCNLYTFKIYKNINININLDLIFDMKPYIPEHLKQKLFEQKYLKYKIKYLNLKYT